jgi:hypothetical protein
MNTLILVLTMGFSAFSQVTADPNIRLPSDPSRYPVKKVRAAPESPSIPGTTMVYSIAAKSETMGPPQQVNNAADGYNEVAASGYYKSVVDSLDDDGLDFDCTGKENCEFSYKSVGATGRKVRVSEVRSGDIRGRQDKVSGAGAPKYENLHLGYITAEKGPLVISTGVTCTKASGTDRDCMPAMLGTIRSKAPAGAPAPVQNSECRFPWSPDQRSANPSAYQAWQEKCEQPTVTQTALSVPSKPEGISERKLEKEFSPKIRDAGGAAN